MVRLPLRNLILAIMMGFIHAGLPVPHRKSWFLLLMILSVRVSTGFGQDTTQAHLAWERGEALRIQAKYGESVSVYLQAGDRFMEAAERLEKQAFSIRGLQSYNEAVRARISLGEYASVASYADSLYGIIRADFAEDRSLMAAATQNTGMVKVGLGQFEEGISYLKQSLVLYEPDSASHALERGLLYRYISLSYSQMGNLELAQQFGMQAVRLHMTLEDSRPDVFAGTVAGMGTMYFSVGMYAEAIQFFDSASQILFRIEPVRFQDISNYYNQIGISYFRLGNPPQARYYFQQALSLLDRKVGAYRIRRAQLLYSLGMTNYILKDLAEAEAKVRQSIKEYGSTPPLEVARSYYSLSQILYMQNQAPSPEMKRALDRAMDLLNGVNIPGLTSPVDIGLVASIYMNVAEGYSLLGESEETVRLLEEGLAFQEKVYGPGHPELANLYAYAGGVYQRAGARAKADSIQYKALRLLAASDSLQISYVIALWDMGVARLNRKELAEAQSYIDRSLHIAQLIRQSYNLESSRLLAQAQFHDLFLIATHIAYYQLEEGGPETLSHAVEIFSYSEQAKAAVLGRSMAEAQIFELPDLAESAKQAEVQAQQKKQHFRQAITLEERRGEGKDEDLLYDLRDSLYVYEQLHDSLLSDLQEQFPRLYEAKANMKGVRVADVQPLLKPEQAVVEYMLSDSNLFVMVIRADTYVVKKVPVPVPLPVLVDSFTQALYGCPDPSTLGCAHDVQLPTYRTLAYELYQQLIAPVADVLPSELIIVPDGVLSYLPFEALLTAPAKGDRARQWPYLLREKTLSYAFSAGLWKEMTERIPQKRPRHSLLAIAPSFADEGSLMASTHRNRGNYFGPLSGTAEEVNRIHAYLGGTILRGEKATLAAFKEAAADFQVLHLATHGKISPDPAYSLLAFYGPEDSMLLPGETIRGISPLYLQDIYSLEIHAELVVLSACETGIGALYKGEGIASLARGFTYAGAKSLVPSLWSVNDAQTADLMDGFYAYLAQGLPKDRALQQAKLDFIAEEGGAPFYWAGFILMGDTSPLEDPGMPFLQWGLILLVVILLGGIYWWVRRR